MEEKKPVYLACFMCGNQSNLGMIPQWRGDSEIVGWLIYCDTCAGRVKTKAFNLKIEATDIEDDRYERLQNTNSL